MKTMTRLFRLRIGTGDIDTFLLRLAEIVCFLIATLVLVEGMRQVSEQDLAEDQFFRAIQQLVQIALLLSVVGLLLHPKSNAT